MRIRDTGSVEFGLLQFARIALQASREVVPRYRRRFSKHEFNQPQVLSVLCLMCLRGVDLSRSRSAFGRVRELCQALGLRSVSNFTALNRFVQSLDDQTPDRAVGEIVRSLRGLVGVLSSRNRQPLLFEVLDLSHY